MLTPRCKVGRISITTNYNSIHMILDSQWMCAIMPFLGPERQLLYDSPAFFSVYKQRWRKGKPLLLR